MKSWENDWISRQGADKSFNVFDFPTDARYLNDLHYWSLQATRKSGLDNDGQGKIPPVWGDKEQWIRKFVPDIKAASQAWGSRRKEIQSLEELGFLYDEGTKSKM